MLRDLFGISTARVLMALVFSKEPIHLREIARRADMAPIQASRVLDKLARIGLVEPNNGAGRLRVFRLRKESAAGSLVCRLVEETQGVISALKLALAREKGVEQAFVYGSFASGSEGLKSDVDLMVVGKPDWASLSRRVSALEMKYGKEINYAICSRKEFEAKKSSPFFSRVLKGEKIFLVGKDDFE